MFLVVIKCKNYFMEIILVVFSYLLGEIVMLIFIILGYYIEIKIFMNFFMIIFFYLSYKGKGKYLL